MSVINLSRVDLNLLLVFNQLMQDRSVTRAAAALNVTQGAVSASLKRLRDLLDDPLFERAGGAMQPTSRALAMAPAIGRSLASVADVLFESAEFDPRRSHDTFHVALSDDIESVLIPWLLHQGSREQWRIRFAFHQSNSKHWPTALNEHAGLVVCSTPESVGGSVRSQLLWSGDYRCLYNPELIRLSEPPTLEEYLAAEHVLVSYNAQRGFVDDVLETRGLGRTVRVSLSHFSGLISALHAAPVIATLPTHAAERFAEIGRLRTSALPIAGPSYSVSMLWDVRSEASPAHRWLRETVARFRPAADS